MAVAITTQQLQLLAPNARTDYKSAFSTANAVLATHGINANKLRLAHFMAQVLHESGGLSVRVESMNYRAERIVAVWPSRFPTVASAEPFAHNPQALANKVYGGRMGNVGANDGWTFIGRGLLQITGRESYEKYGGLLDIPLAANPDLAFGPDWSLKIAAEEWNSSGCNTFADQDSIRKVTRAINGGLIGLADRQDWLAKTKNIWH
jgi:putative chitinase